NGTAQTRTTNEAAHRKDIDQRVVKRLSDHGVGCGTHAAYAASVSWLGERKRSYVDAELVFRRGANPGFRVDGATQMIVEVRAFGHFLEQVAKLQRVRTRCVEVESAAALSFGLRSRRMLHLGLSRCPRREKEKKNGKAPDSQLRNRS